MSTTPTQFRSTVAALAALVAAAAMLSCSTSSTQPPSLPGSGAGGGGLNDRLPQILFISPDETCATAGNLIQIQGTNLVDADRAATVLINNVPADVIDRIDGDLVTPDVLVVQTRAQTVPAGGISATVTVDTGGGRVSSPAAIRLLPGCTGAPIAAGLNPATGPRIGGGALTLSGNNLACITDLRFVGTMGGGTISVDLVSVSSDNTVVIEAPITGSTTNESFNLVVTTACGTDVLEDAFTFIGSGAGTETVPNATGIFDIATGLPQGPTAGGNTVRITGADLDTSTSLTIGSGMGAITLVRNTDFVVTANGDIVIFTMPASPGGASLMLTLDVVVRNAVGEDPSPVPYTYIGAGAPQCFTIEPDSGPITGGTEVTITGLNLNDIDRVLIGGVDAGTIFRPDVDGERILVLSPSFQFAIAGVDIELQIQGSGDTFTTIETCNPATFTYFDDNAEPPFSLSGINPTSGPATGGTTVIITGTGLGAVNSVRICGLAATIIPPVLDEQIRANTGAFVGNVPVTCDVTVSTSAGESATLPASFTYLPVVPNAIPPFAPGSATTAPACGGTTFRLDGTNFAGATGVSFSGTQTMGTAQACDVQVQSNTQISGTAPQYITPNGPFPANVNVIVRSSAGGDPTPLTFRYYDNPALLSARGPSFTRQIDLGEIVTLTGINFRPESDVFVGSVTVTNSGVSGSAAAGSLSTLVAFTVLDDNTIQFTFPFSTPDAYDITIRTPLVGRSCTAAECASTIEQALVLGAPTAGRVSPDTGPYTGGTTVTITGNFPFAPSSVTFCGQPAAVISSNTTTITVQTRSIPEASANVPCDIVITTTAGTDTIPDGFTYIADPDPTAAQVVTAGCGTLSTATQRPIPVVPGQTVTIVGDDLTGVTSVTIGTDGTAATIAPINGATRTDTSIEITVPAQPAMATGSLDINLIAPFTASTITRFIDTIGQAIRYQGLPAITTIAPTSARAGDIVTLTGTDLANVNGATPTVFFGATPAVVVSSTATQVRVLVPAGTQGSTVLLSIQTCTGSASTQFTYLCNAPVITSIAPPAGSLGDTVTITGTDLVDADGIPAFPTVRFGTTTATVTSATATSVTVTVPPGTLGQSVAVTLTTCGGTGTSPNQFQYACTRPTVNAIAPTAGVAGTVLTISGINLDSPDGGQTIVFFDPTPMTPTTDATPVTPTSVTATAITVTVPAGMGTASIVVQNCAGQGTAPVVFTYCPTPNATSVAPTSGAAGATVTISGTNLADVSGAQPVVRFGTTQATIITVMPTALTVQAPAGVTGQVNVTVQTCGGTPDTAGTFLFCSAPTITAITPVQGPAGTTVTIDGTNLIGANGAGATITFGSPGVVATPILTTATRIVVTAPAGPVGQAAVQATTCGGPVTASTPFTYCILPVITSLTPTNGPTGTEVVIAGTNLVGANGASPTVRFGTANATLVDATATAVTVIAPAGTGVQQVRLTTCGGTSATNAATPFTYQATTTCVAPTLTAITPTSGPNTGGTTVTLTGTNLISNDGTTPTTVTFNGVSAPVITLTATQVVVSSPSVFPTTGPVAVAVTTCGGTANAGTPFTYCGVPALMTINPATGPAGQVVVLTGTNLTSATGAATQVLFGFTPGTVLDATPTQLTVTAPAGFTAGTPVSVRAVTCGGTSSSQTFTFTGATVCTAPTVSSIVPTAGSAGTLVTITGTNLRGADNVDPVVRFGGAMGPMGTVVTSTATQITVTAPAGTGTVAVRVTTCGGFATAPQPFTYCTTPTITTIAPTSGTSGTVVVLTGTGLVGADGQPADVFFDTTPANVIDSLANGTRIRVTAPAGFAAGSSVSVTALTCGGTVTSGTNFTYATATSCALPTITSVTPATGQTGTVVTIAGTNFVSSDGTTTRVLFEGVQATVLSTAPNQLLVTAPSGIADGTPADVRVITCGGVALDDDAFLYASTVNCMTPTIATVSPATGNSGTAVTITGTNLVGADNADTTVLFDTTEANVLNQSANSLLVQAPTGFAAGSLVDVTVITCGGSVTDGDGFQYEAVTAFDVTAVTPDSGPRTGGQTIVITGTGLNGVNDIEICDVDVTSIMVVDSTRVEAVTSAFNGPAPVDCDVEVSDGTNSDTLADGYTYLPLVPDASAFGGASAQTAPAAGGTFVMLTGVRMLDTDELQFGGNVGDPTACGVQALDDSTVIGIAPALETGETPSAIDVSIFAASEAGRDSTPVTGFTYYPNPTATALTGNCGSGCSSAGSTVTVTGTNFRPETWDHVGTVVLSGQEQTGTDPMSGDPIFEDVSYNVAFTITGNTTLTFVVPAGIDAGAFDVTITTTGSTASCANDYTYTLGNALVVP